MSVPSGFEMVVRFHLDGQVEEERVITTHLPAVGGEIHLTRYGRVTTIRRIYHRMVETAITHRNRFVCELELVVELDDVPARGAPVRIQRPVTEEYDEEISLEMEVGKNDGSNPAFSGVILKR